MKNLLKKLSEVKKEIGAISKDSKNPFYKSAYFDINALLEHCEPLLQKNGLLLTQPIYDNKVWSTIYHVESGEEITSCIDLPDLNDPQKLGSAITYYRRYTLQSLLALQSEDDDGNKASKPPTPKKEVIKTAKKLTDANIKASIEKGTQQVVLDGIKAKLYDVTDEQVIELNESLKA